MKHIRDLLLISKYNCYLVCVWGGGGPQFTITTNEPIHENKNVGRKVKLSWNLAHTVPSQVGHSFEGSGF